jgi:FkbM family methyltransferase
MRTSSPNIVAQSKYGPIIVNAFDQFIGKSVLRNGVWDEINIALLRKLIELKLSSKNQVIFYDVGANIGTHSLALAKIFGGRIQIRAFEAQPMLYNMLCGTIALNNLDNVVVYLNAVAEKAGDEIVFNSPDYLQENNFGGLELAVPFRSDNQNMQKSGKKSVIKTIAIDTIAEDVDFIKMDIEGVEIKALSGAQQTIKKSRPILLVEIMKSNPEEIKQFFNQKEYKTYANKGDMLAIPREVQIDIS